MRDTQNIFLHFLNRDTQEMFGFTFNGSEEHRDDKLRRALNVSVLLCDDEKYCLLPVGFWFESSLTRNLLKESKEFFKNGYIRFSIRENNLYEFLEKKREQYSGFQNSIYGKTPYDTFYEQSVFEDLIALDPVLIDRKTKVGRYCSEIWGREHRLLIQQNSGDMLKIYSNIDKCDLLSIIPHFHNIVRDPEKPFVWASVQETLSELNIKDSALKKDLRSYFEKNYYDAYLQEYKATILMNCYFLDKGLNFGFTFPDNSVANYVWFEAFLSALSLENILCASSAKISQIKKSISWAYLLNIYVELCNNPSFQSDTKKRKILCIQTCNNDDAKKHIENIKEILKMQDETIRKQVEVPTVDVLIMIATVEEENAIIHNDRWDFKKTDNGYGYYYRKEGLSFALARSIDMGPMDAAAATQFFVSTLHPRFLSMAGFCAGKKGSVNLGDVFVPNKIYSYEGGKQISENETLPDMNMWALDPLWRQKIERLDNTWRQKIKIQTPVPFDTQMKTFIELLQSQEYSINQCQLKDNKEIPDIDHIVRDEIEANHLTIQESSIVATSEGKKYYQELNILKYTNYREPELTLRMGTLATGNKVKQWDEVFKILAEKYDRKTYAIDMEGIAVSSVARIQHIPCLIAKGVGDYASHSKAFDNRYVDYAVFSSYRFIVEFFNNLHDEELLNS